MYKNKLLKYFFCILAIAGYSNTCHGQQPDSARIKELREVIVVGYSSMNGIGHFFQVQSPIIYAGKKTEVIEVDSIDANKAINNTRQILGRIPGLNIVESETGGFVANGVGYRGLNPVQSLDMNVRQNGYNISADVYGYNETYYLPPMEAVARVELIKGASAFQFGPQLGGMINYVLKEANKSKTFSLSATETFGSAGLFNSYLSGSGGTKKWNYFSFINYRILEGWRMNSSQQQLTGFGKLGFQPSQRMSISIEYSLLRNKIKMPGGLTDEQFEQDSRQSVRSRNWLKSPWNILSASLKYDVSTNTEVTIQSTFLKGERSLVWVNALPNVPDDIDPQTGEYDNREVDKELMKSLTVEFRLLHQYKLGRVVGAFAGGLRFSAARFERLEEAMGTNGSDFDLSTLSEYEEEFDFSTINIAPFIENSFRFGTKFSITPALRFESLSSEAEAEYEVGGVEKETEEEKSRNFILFGLGLQYQAGKTMNLYGNISQAYRPLDYSQLVPFGSVSVVDPDMKDPKGWNSDIGIRGKIKNIFNYDIGLFFIDYQNRIGLILKTDNNGSPYTYRTNTAQSHHRGIESYLELNITRCLQLRPTVGELNIFNSFAYTKARYSKGEYKGNSVEYSPEIINRAGLLYSRKHFSTSFQVSQQSKAYTDPANTERSQNPIIGAIPGYTVMDWSSTIKWGKIKIKGGVNNLGNKRYFTQRTDEYPGPGIIPSIGRNFYAGVGLDL